MAEIQIESPGGSRLPCNDQQSHRDKGRLPSLQRCKLVVTFFAYSVYHRQQLLQQAAERDVRWPRHRQEWRLANEHQLDDELIVHECRVQRLLTRWFPSTNPNPDPLTRLRDDAIREVTRAGLDDELVPLIDELRDESGKVTESAVRFMTKLWGDNVHQSAWKIIHSFRRIDELLNKLRDVNPRLSERLKLTAPPADPLSIGKTVERQTETRQSADEIGGQGKAGGKPAKEAQQCQKHAYYASRYAELKLERKLYAHEVYEYWKEYGFDSADKDTENAGVLAGYELPDAFPAFQSNLSRGRTFFNDNRYENREGRKGRSIVGEDEI